MIRQIIHIDEDKCTGCGLCASACHEGAIDIVDGKAKLMRENFCDGFGDCLPNCPTGAITFENREAPDYDEAAVEAAKKKKAILSSLSALRGSVQKLSGTGSCPGSAVKTMQAAAPAAEAASAESALTNWPPQIRLAPVTAPYYDGAELLVAADCTAFTYGAFHADFIRGRTTLFGCPKLDPVDYSEKLAEILRSNDIRGITLVRMTVPCCGGLERALTQAIADSGKQLPLRTVVISTEGAVAAER